MSKPRKRQASCVPTYTHVLKKWAEWEKRHPSARPEDKMRELGDICRKTIDRHLRKCLCEAGRSGDKARRRYAWDTGRGVIYLWVPRAVSIKRLLAVLHRELHDADAGRAGEKERAQAIVDNWFPGRWVSFDISGITVPAAGTDPVSFAMRNEIKACKLVSVVAAEMAANIGNVRPSIQCLGPEKVQQMVTRILEDQISGTYSPNAVAKEYGVCPPNLSHFAAKKWLLGGKLPDLWAHVLEVANRYPALVEALQDAMPANIAVAAMLRGDKTGAAEQTEALDPGMLEKASLLLDRLSAKRLAAQVDRPIALAPRPHDFSSHLCKSSEEFVAAISHRYVPLLQSLGASGVSAADPTTQEDAVALVDRAYQRAGGFQAALAEAKEGLHGGLCDVFKAMTEQFRRESRAKYSKRVFEEIVGPLGWPDMVALIRAFLAKAGPTLPADIRSQTPERLARNFEGLVEAYVESMDTVKELFRTL